MSRTTQNFHTNAVAYTGTPTTILTASLTGSNAISTLEGDAVSITWLLSLMLYFSPTLVFLLVNITSWPAWLFFDDSVISSHPFIPCLSADHVSPNCIFAMYVIDLHG